MGRYLHMYEVLISISVPPNLICGCQHIINVCNQVTGTVNYIINEIYLSIFPHVFIRNSLTPARPGEDFTC